ncbi:MAG: 30S ribosomal protein S15 [Planctomycetia bacterium]|nr:30S ribosomal protein S15 [Planctomycetia bacterium]
MSITKEEKQATIQQFKRCEGDTGSTEVQIALLTKRINALTEHMQANTKDYACRRGLLSLVSQRRGLLDYLKDIAPQRYLDVIQKLNIRK